ncbi:MAG: hypothetical protein AAFO07_15360 [Bacteroidota bacterium]
MKNISFLLIVIFLSSCSYRAIEDIPTYFELVNKAELSICKGEYQEASDFYDLSFKEIEKPLGKDVFNAALASQLADLPERRNQYLQILINNLDEISFLKHKFVYSYMTKEEWQQLMDQRELAYNTSLKEEMKQIVERDQHLRPMYDSHDEEINANRKMNLARIFQMTDSTGLPSQFELGYDDDLKGQDYHIVLHHTAQRRSRDKSVVDLEPFLLEAVEEGRIDPETAIFYMNFQNDPEKGRFEVYSSWQYQHDLLPDSLNNKVWRAKLTAEQKLAANKIRANWHANSLEDIAIKSKFVANNDLPFIFSCVKNSIGKLKYDFDKATALEQYVAFTSFMEEN